MARVNCGVNPLYLYDQHLVAESVEITMIVGSLRVNGYVIKGFEPREYKLGKGHINFFKRRIKYLSKRLVAVNEEMVRRGFSPGTSLDYTQYPIEYGNDWYPTMVDSQIVRQRIVNKIVAKEMGFWRYCRKKIESVTYLIDTTCNISGGELFVV